jgi:hypothetical protein
MQGMNERVNEDEDGGKGGKRKDWEWDNRHLMISNLSPSLERGRQGAHEVYVCDLTGLGGGVTHFFSGALIDTF